MLFRHILIHASLAPVHKGMVVCLFPAAHCVSVVLTPSNEKEDPLSKLVRGIGHYNGCVKVASFNKHPEKVSHHKVVVNGRN